MKCPFCNLGKDILYDTEHFYIKLDKYPVNPGHMLVISKRHTAHFFSLNQLEKDALPGVIDICKGRLEETINPDGFNIGMNCGEVAGQTVLHFHCHVIPRHKRDTADPRGGVRLCVPERGNYLT